MTAGEKIDLYKQHKDQYKAGKKPILLTAEEASYLAIDGRGEHWHRDTSSADAYNASIVPVGR